MDNILQGAKPADLPIEHPTTCDLVLNLTTAKALGRTLSPALLIQATEVIHEACTGGCEGTETVPQGAPSWGEVAW